MTRAKSVRVSEIPLYLLGLTLTRLVCERGGKVYRISVVRTHYHHYNISVRTRSIHKELRRERELTIVAPDEEESAA